MADRRKIRNICILAHVDHGKTTLADHLIAACGGGLVHPKLAGRLRFMDYLDEEQRRAITMKSSSIALQFRDHSINLIDSPGHMDFCSEVSTAVRMSDGAVVLVDAVEGVHIQTHAVLRQAWAEKLTPCLVLNKIDRLITELKLNPMEAYTRLQRIIHEVNSIISAYQSEKYLSDVDSLLASQSSSELPEEEEDRGGEEEDAFQPQKGNVVFACALDGWGFRLGQFADMYAAKLGASAGALLRGLWGQRYFNMKKRMIVGKKGLLDHGGGRDPQPMFVQFVLRPLWQVYEAVGDREKLEKVIQGLNLSVPVRELQNKDPRLVLQAVMSRWLPLSEAVLSMVVDNLPDPVAAQSLRISRLIPRRDDTEEPALADAEEVRHAVEACDPSDASPTVAFVSKMFAVPLKMLPPCEEDEPIDDEEECFLAFARIFSGVLRRGQHIFVLSALHDPRKFQSAEEEDGSKHVQKGEVRSLYLMMGQGLKPVVEASAGSLVAIRGLGKQILKSATLCSTPNCWPFSSLMFQVAPTVKVAIEATDPSDMAALARGLRLLNRADPFVEVAVSARGEHVLSAAGEVHLERCVKDLRDRFAKVSLEVSPPLVSFRETIDEAAPPLVTVAMAERRTPNSRCLIRARVMRLPAALTKLLEEGSSIHSRDNNVGDPALRKRMEDALTGAESAPELLQRMLAHAGTNILLSPPLTSKGIEIAGTKEEDIEEGALLIPGPVAGLALEQQNPEVESLRSSIVSGFQLAAAAGPLCEEPMWGLGFEVEVLLLPGSSAQQGQEQLHGQTMAAVKEACRAAVLKAGARLVEAMYFCELSTTMEYLGPMYAVLSRRRARVLSEEMQEGSPRFTVQAYVPVAESFGFADELRRWTSGAASALLVLSHWEALKEDPFFAPKTEEEVEEFGDGASVPPNAARKLVDAVRRRKGLPVEEKVVRHATKQRTLARKV
ncbi:ribosomal protein S5/Elongation factor G/III/V family protein [Wolffia australiana]